MFSPGWRQSVVRNFFSVFWENIAAPRKCYISLIESFRQSFVHILTSVGSTLNMLCIHLLYEPPRRTSGTNDFEQRILLGGSTSAAELCRGLLHSRSNEDNIVCFQRQAALAGQHTWNLQDNQEENAEEQRGLREQNCFRLTYLVSFRTLSNELVHHSYRLFCGHTLTESAKKYGVDNPKKSVQSTV